MTSNKRYLFLMTILMLGVSACGGESTPDPTIATAVAQTVAAQNSLQNNTSTPAAPVEPLITKTPLQFLPTLTPIPTVLPPTLPGSTQKSACAQASLVSETIPDGQIFRPGEIFYKTWEIQNISSCYWSTSYKIIWWDGDPLGGAYIYNLPQAVPSGGIVPITLQLTAPETDGDYISEWMLETPDGIDFGVGEYSVPFYADIAVSDDKHPDYTITKVEYQIIREPATGCPANTRYTVIATVTTNGPFEFYYYWTQKDGNNTDAKYAEFEEAGSKTFERAWTFGIANTPGEKWIEFNVSDPFQKSYGKATWVFDCGAY